MKITAKKEGEIDYEWCTQPYLCAEWLDVSTWGSCSRKILHFKLFFWLCWLKWFFFSIKSNLNYYVIQWWMCGIVGGCSTAPPGGWILYAICSHCHWRYQENIFDKSEAETIFNFHWKMHHLHRPLICRFVALRCPLIFECKIAAIIVDQRCSKHQRALFIAKIVISPWKQALRLCAEPLCSSQSDRMAVVHIAVAHSMMHPWAMQMMWILLSCNAIEMRPFLSIVRFNVHGDHGRERDGERALTLRQAQWTAARAAIVGSRLIEKGSRVCTGLYFVFASMFCILLYCSSRNEHILYAYCVYNKQRCWLKAHRWIVRCRLAMDQAAAAHQRHSDRKRWQ